jgi:hypothetical protein
MTDLKPYAKSKRGKWYLPYDRGRMLPLYVAMVLEVLEAR